MPYESGLERDFLRLCDFDPSIRNFQSQPLRLTYCRDGRQRSYSPDVLIGPDCLVEVKPEFRARGPEFRQWVGAVRKACAELGYEFQVVTDVEIRRQPRLNNVVLLRRYYFASLADAVRLDVSAWVREAPGITLGELFQRLDNAEGSLSGLYGLMARHEVRFDVDRTLDADLPIFPLENKET